MSRMPGVSTARKRKRENGNSTKATRSKPPNRKVKPRTENKIIDVPEQSRQIEEQDEEFFEGDEVGDYAFLQRLNAAELGTRVQKEKLPRQEPAPPKASAKLLVSSFSDDEDEYSDEAGLDEAVCDALDTPDLPERDWNEEQPYEELPRKGDSQWRKKESTRLPVRTASGKLLQMDPASASGSDSESSDETEVSDSDSEGEAIMERQVTEDTVIKSGPQSIIEAKEALAKLAEEVVESPDEKVSNLKAFREIFNKGNPTVKKLCLVTQLTVYKDIIPGYRIRPLSDLERQTKVSKEVKQLRAFEESLLSNYKSYISSLVTVIKSARTNDLLKPLSMIAVTCATNLLTTVPHFNFRTDLLKIIVAQLSRRQADEAFVKCRNALEALFREDEEGRAGLEAVSMISKMIKSRDYRVHPSLIQSFFHLRLLSELDVKASTDKVEIKHSKKDRVFRTKKERKEHKERKKLEKEFAEADAQVSAEEREHLQSDTLKIVFSLYFQILKDPKDNAMLAVVLDGIAKFAKLINAEFFGDLLVVLREILESWDNEDSLRADRQDTNKLREELVCLNTAFTLLANQGGSDIDLSFFIERFYHLLPEISLSRALLVKPTPEEKSLMELAVRILDAILLSSHTTPPPARIFMFYKRLLTCILQMDEKEATTFLKVLQRMNNRYEKKIQGMWDREGAGLGNLESARVRGWELGLSKDHYSTNVRQMSKALWKVDGNVS